LFDQQLHMMFIHNVWITYITDKHYILVTFVFTRRQV